MVSLNNITKIYRKNSRQVLALDQVTLEVPQGGFLSVVGHSGSGKTTLMNIIGCMDSPTSGSYLLDGEAAPDVKSRKAAEARNRKIGFVFQGFNLVPSMSALENVELPLVFRGVPHSQRKKKALTALELVGLADRAHHRPAELSGGQQQRVAIARVLAGEPQLILADEPTGNLDRRSAREVISTICSLNDMGRTVIMITHDMEVAAAAKTIAAMQDGRLEYV